MSADATVTPSARRFASRLRIDDTTIQAVVALTAGAALLRFLALSTQSYWYDEAITVELVRRPFSAMLGAVPQSESTPPLYYVLAWIWSQIFGTDEAGLRSLSAALGTATVPATYAAGRQFVSRRSAFVAAALVAVSPLLVWYSQEARAYALLVLLGALSLIPLRQAAGLRPGGPLTAWAVFASLALATHYFAVFLIAAEAAWLLWRASEMRAALRGSHGCRGRRSGTRRTCCIPGAVRGTHRLDFRIPAGLPAESRTSSTSSSSANTRRRTSDRSLVAVPIVLLVGLFMWTAPDERSDALLMLGFAVAAIAPPAVLALVSDNVWAAAGTTSSIAT
jgi:Dolichyl-phosphate-mannose-protein mannosyltransferase